MNTTKARSSFKWRSILSNFMSDKSLSGQHAPCPLCGGTDRFRFEPESERGNYFCSCGPGTGIHLVAQLKCCSYAEAWKLIEPFLNAAEIVQPKAVIDRTARINNVLKVSRQIEQGGEVWRYLQSRGIMEMPAGLFESRTKSGVAMMVGRFANGAKCTGLHVTFLKNGMQDASYGSAKKMYSYKQNGLNGSAIRLSPLGDGNRIVVAEGIETAASASLLFSAPAWATGSAGLLEQVIIPDCVKEVVIAGDNDSSFTGQAAAFNLAKRLTILKKSVIVHIPPNKDEDFNDVFKAQTVG